MNCEACRIHMYEGTLPPEARAHLDACPGCAELQRRIAGAEALLRFDVRVDPRYAEAGRRLVMQKLPAVEPEPAHPWLLRWIRVAVLAMAVVGIFYGIGPNRAPQTAGQSASTQAPDIPFELQKVDANVVRLTWKGNPGDEYRIYKGPTPANMKPVEAVRGVQWLDQSADSAPIVFYKVEQM